MLDWRGFLSQCVSRSRHWGHLSFEFCCVPREKHRVTQRRGLNRRALDHPTVCCCIPIRSAVFVSAFLTVVFALAMLVMRTGMESGLRVFTGGYELRSRVIVDLLEISGVVWGPIGMSGVLFLRTSHVRTFFYYQVFRLVGWFIMYMTDVPLLWNCELWNTDIKAATAQYGWNDLMYGIAVMNGCERERTLFVACSTTGFFVFLYFTMATQWLLSDLDDEPRYLLRVPQDRPDGAFYATSLASNYGSQQKRVLGDPVKDPGFMAASAPMGKQLP